MFLAKIYISPKPTVNDPEGLTIQGSLAQLGYHTVTSVRVGKYIEIQLDEDSESEATAKIREICDSMLANPVIEGYRFDLE